MPVAVEMDFPGATLEQYDEVIRKMGFAPGGPGAPAGISHWVARTDTGIRIVDVWETAADFERFAQEQIRPYAHEAGFPGEPEVRMHEVHTYLTPGPGR